ncbi:hypothetical protein Tco_1378140 [Tanacetum coccineum]
MGTPTLVCVWSCPNFSAPAGRPFRCVSDIWLLISGDAKQNQLEANEIGSGMQRKTQDPLALVTTTDNSYPYVHSQGYLPQQPNTSQSFSPRQPFSIQQSALIDYASSRSSNIYELSTPTAQVKASFEPETVLNDPIPDVTRAMAMLTNVVFSIWKAFGGNTRDFGSFGEETDKTTNLHQHLLRISTQKLEMASQITRDAVTTHLKTASQDLKTASECTTQPII